MGKSGPSSYCFCSGYAVLTGGREVIDAALAVPYRTLDLVIKVGGIIVFYNGLFQIALDSGMIDNLARLFRKPIRALFPDLAEDSPPTVTSARTLPPTSSAWSRGDADGDRGAKGNAEGEPRQGRATRAMLTLMLLNVTSFTLFPATIVGIREIYKARITMELIPFIIAATFILTVVAIIISRFVKVKDDE